MQQRFFVKGRKGKEIETQNVVHLLRDREILQRSLNGKLTWPSEERERGSAKIVPKAGAEIEAKNWKKRYSDFAFLRRSINNLNLSDFSYSKHVDGQIRLRGIKSV